MADSKITALTAITTVNPATYPLVIVDTSDTSMAGTGTTKKVTTNQLLGAGGTATLASATITGDLTVATNRLSVSSTGVQIGTTTNKTTAFTGNGTGLTIGAALAPTIALWDTTNASYVGSISQIDADMYLTNTAVGQMVFSTDNTTRYTISSTGVATWSNVGGVAGTAMTLNSTGLGVGTSPTYKLDVAGQVMRLVSPASTAEIFLTDSGTTNGYVRIRGESNALKFVTGNGTSATIDSSGNVGIGVTPSAWSSGIKVLEFGTKGGLAGSGSDVNLIYNAYYDGSNKYRTSDYANNFQISGGQFKWLTAPSGTAGNVITYTQAMTLDASGNLLVGVTSTTTPGVGNTTAGGSLNANGAAFFSNASSQALYLNTNVDGQIVSIRRSNVAVGSISVTTTATAYNTSSDYRLKEAVQPLVGGLARVSALKPSIYKWKADGSNGEGFLAHELAEVVPLAVTGEKDAVNEDGSIKAQGVDLSKVVPILVAAIKELAAEVNALKNA